QNAWLNLALAEQSLGNAEGELAAINEVLKIEPRTLVALLLKAGHYERVGQPTKAAQAYSAALQVAPPFEEVPNELKGAGGRAADTPRRPALDPEAFIRERAARAYGGHNSRELRRFDEALDVVVGRKAIYRQNPLLMFWPGLPMVQFFPREQFPWLDAVEA